MSQQPAITSNLRKVSRRGHVLVDSLPRHPADGSAYWLNSPNGRHEYLHLLFRFPARFHPPVVRWALTTYGKPGDFVLDPFVGSGTVPLEAISAGMSSVGLDVDPLACLIAAAKTHPLSERSIRNALSKIEKLVRPYRARHEDRECRAGSDISPERYEREAARLDIPPIPNITHWFRRYVIVDIARLLRAIDRASLTPAQATFLQACVAAVIRRVSNADPAPVSGLEVTSVQAEKNTSRKIKVFEEFDAKVNQALKGMKNLYGRWDRRAEAEILEGDALDLRGVLRTASVRQRNFNLVVTSPPYCTAVEYSRRHKLEMFWLGLVDSSEDHISLRHNYIGRPHVRARDWEPDEDLDIPGLDHVTKRVSDVDPHKARGINHYFSSMAFVLDELHRKMSRKSTAIIVIGDSVICGVRVPTTRFLTDLASESFKLKKTFSYALRNQFMQYGLWNGHGINKERVLVLKPR